MYGISHRRFTLTEKWKSPIFRKLSPNEKCVYYYLWENCDLAGFYEIDKESISFYTQVPQTEIDSILIKLKEEEITTSNDWLFILNYIEYQGNGNLNPNNNAHKAIIPKLCENIVHFEQCVRTQNNLAPYKDLISSSSKSKSKCLGKGIDKGIDKGLGNDIPLEEEILKVRYIKNGEGCAFCGAVEFELCKLERCKSDLKYVFKETVKNAN